MRTAETFYLAIFHRTGPTSIVKLTDTTSEHSAMDAATMYVQGIKCDDGEFSGGLLSGVGGPDVRAALVLKQVGSLCVEDLRREVVDAERAARDPEFAHYLELKRKYEGGG